MLEKIFRLSERATSVKTEMIAGITTFMTMAYILFLNPNILAATGIDKNASFFATAVTYLSVKHNRSINKFESFLIPE